MLEARSEFVAGGTGELGLAITNNATDTAQASFDIRATDGIGLVSGGRRIGHLSSVVSGLAVVFVHGARRARRSRCRWSSRSTPI